MEQLEIDESPFRILSLDGGGSLGIYTLGVLTELEAKLGGVLRDHLEMVYGTSTGSIIACRVADGIPTSQIYEEYLEIAPDIFKPTTAGGKSQRLSHHAAEIFKDKRFNEFEIHLGVVATDLELNRPMIFKSNVGQAHRQTATFEPGFGCTVADAVRASCSAYPVFDVCILETSKGTKTLVDGGFSANNPALFSLVDALRPLEIEKDRIRLCSVGTGVFPMKKHYLQRFSTVDTITTLLGTNANSLDGIRDLLYGDVSCVRVSEATTNETYKTNFTERDPENLERIHSFGRNSYNKHEDDLVNLFGQ